MKLKFLLYLAFSFIFFNFVFAKEQKLPEVMKQMENDAVLILKGFLRDNNDWIIKGAEGIKNHPDILDEVFSYTKPERRTEAFKKYIKEFDTFVRKEAEFVEKYIKKGNKAKASEHFAKLIDRCNGCHAIFRGW